MLLDVLPLLDLVLHRYFRRHRAVVLLRRARAHRVQTWHDRPRRHAGGRALRARSQRVAASTTPLLRGVARTLDTHGKAMGANDCGSLARVRKQVWGRESRGERALPLSATPNLLPADEDQSSLEWPEQKRVGSRKKEFMDTFACMQFMTSRVLRAADKPRWWAVANGDDLRSTE